MHIRSPICVLLGSQVAHILRPVTNALTLKTFIIIGLAYVYSFIDKEVLKFYKAKKLKLEIFYLI